MTTPQNRQRQQQEQGSGQHTPTGIRMNVRRSSDEQLVEISPAFRILQKHRAEQPSSTQWREFSRRLSQALDKEAERKSRFWSIQVIRDKFTSTDSRALRALGYMLLAVALAGIAVGIWLLSASLLAQPTAEVSAAQPILHAPLAAVATLQLPVSEPFTKA
jgi:hypothetical protein